MENISEYVRETPIAEILHRREEVAIIVGAGGVGSWLSLFLASSELYDIIVVDHDRVAQSDLHRSCYTKNDIGEYKARVIVEKMRKVGSRDYCAFPDTFQNFVCSFYDQIKKSSYKVNMLLIFCVDNTEVYKNEKIVRLVELCRTYRVNCNGVVFTVERIYIEKDLEKITSWRTDENIGYRFRIPTVNFAASLAYMAILNLIKTPIIGEFDFRRKEIRIHKGDFFCWV